MNLYKPNLVFHPPRVQTVEIPYFPNIEAIESKEEGRRYLTPEGNLYPSITSILDESCKYQSWRDSVGEDFANYYIKKAQQRGTDFHNYYENYFRSQTFSFKTKYDKLDFEKVLPFLKKIKNIHCIERALWSDQYKIAGRVDLIGEYDEVLSVIDYKTSSKDKQSKDILNYWIQATAYALMYKERTGIEIKNLVILMLVESELAKVMQESLHIDQFLLALNENVA